MKYGKFVSFEDFLESYKASQDLQFETELAHKSHKEKVHHVREKTKNRDVVEVNATITEHQPDEGNHYHLLIALASIEQSDADIEQDLNRCLGEHEPVFLAIRFGDKQGISQPIDSGLEKGSKLHLKGEWIPKDAAYNHGGEKMSVLHFTHKPLGFVCTEQDCYS